MPHPLNRLSVDTQPDPIDPAAARSLELVEANIIAIHAYQIALAQKSKKSDLDEFAAAGGLSAKDLQALVSHQAALLASDPAAIKAWVQGQPSAFDRTKDLDSILAAPLKLSPRLPINVLANYFSANSKAGRTNIRAVASLYQIAFEIARDGDVLQDLYAFYINLGLAVYGGQLGLPGADADHLALGEQLTGQTCNAPYECNAADWQLAGARIWSWGLKHQHIRDATVLAQEILQEKEVRDLLPQIKAMPAQKIAILGHSFTMKINWSTPGPFTEIASSIFQQVNPRVTIQHWTRGGMSAATAQRFFYQKVLESKPDKLFVFVVVESPLDQKAMVEMVRGFEAAGIAVYVFPRNVPGNQVHATEMQQFAEANHIKLINFQEAIEASPDKSSFPCLDKIHMTEPYHRLMAKEFLKFLAISPLRS